MNMKKIYLFLACILTVSVLVAQESYINQITFANQKASKKGGNVAVGMDINLDKLDIRSNHMIVLTPVLKSNNGSTTLELAPVVINGGRRDKAFSRSRALNDQPVFQQNPQTVIHRRNNTAQTIHYETETPIGNWMKDAQLMVREEVRGCAECGLGKGELPILANLLPPDFVPVYRLTYIEPEVEPVKQRSEKHAARFNYKVARAELLPNFANNAAELAQVNKVISEIKNDKNLSITNLTISGYASPEGSVSSNMDLSQRRANTFSNYLSNKYGLDKNQFKVSWYGEDWKGLEEAVKTSTLADKNEILRIISEVSNPDARDPHLMKLSNGETYRTLLQTYYPPLRRNEYTVAYVARGFDVNQAKEIIRTKPQHLSLNEMFLVAQTYPADSKEFKEVFDIAVRLFPNSEIAIMNSAAADIEGGNMDAAINRLEKIKNNPKAWNNLGVAYARKGDTAKAREYFSKAAANADADAKKNMEQLNLLLENQ